MFHRNAWHVAALPHEVDRELRRRTILGQPVLLYRQIDGSLAALTDRCPHRFAPLSRGTLDGNVVECKYHGMRFNGAGACVLNPHGDVISPNMHIHRYPAAERHGLVWIWTGNPDAASLNDIPDLSYMEAPGTRTVHSYIRTSYRYDILVDNLLDLSHADYLHKGTFSGGVPERSDTQVRPQGDEVIVVRAQYGAPPPPRFPDLGNRVDLAFTIHWRPGQVINFEWRSAPPGQDLAQGRMLSRFAHIATPETDRSTHYFMSMTREHDIDDAALDAQISRYQTTVVQNEDGAMLDAIDAEMNGADLMDLRPVVLPTDKGGLQVRRVMKRLLRQQAEHDASPAPPLPVAAK